MSVYEKTLIQRQNNVEHQIVEVVLLTHFGFNIEISTIFEFYVKSTLFLRPWLLNILLKYISRKITLFQHLNNADQLTVEKVLIHE